VQAEQAARSQWYDNLGVYATGAILTAEDIYNNFGHNHTSYPTTRGGMKDFGDYKRISDYSDQALKYKKISNNIKILGALGSALMTAQAGTKIYNEEATAWDYGDFTVGAAGTVTGAAELLGLSTVPVVGEVVAAYSWFRLWYDLGDKYGPSKWYGTDDRKWFK